MLGKMPRRKKFLICQVDEMVGPLSVIAIMIRCAQEGESVKCRAKDSRELRAGFVEVVP